MPKSPPFFAPATDPAVRLHCPCSPAGAPGEVVKDIAMSLFLGSRRLTQLHRLLLVLGIIAVATGSYLYSTDSPPASQTPLPEAACHATVTLSDGSEEPLAMPGCAAFYRQQPAAD